MCILYEQIAIHIRKQMYQIEYVIISNLDSTKFHLGSVEEIKEKAIEYIKYDISKKVIVIDDIE
jgi:hypothetical protein